MTPLNLIMDYREEHHIPWPLFLQKEDCFTFSRERLDVGDFHIENKQGEKYMILERKTISDFIASIKDGRYTEQKLRMLSLKHHHPQAHIGYIVEGSMCFDPSANEYQSLIGAIINSTLRDHVLVFRTKDAVDTAHLILQIIKRFFKNPLLAKEQGNDHAPNMTKYLQNSQSTLLKEKKKDNYDAKACMITQLACIPQISIKKAEIIVDHLEVANMFALAKMFHEKGPDVFKDIPHIGPRIQENLIAFLS